MLVFKNRHRNPEFLGASRLALADPAGVGLKHRMPFLVNGMNPLLWLAASLSDWRPSLAVSSH